MKIKIVFQSAGFSTVLLIILAGILIAAAVGGGVYYAAKRGKIAPTPAPTAIVASPSPAKVPAVLAKLLIKPEDIVLEKADVTPQIPKYELPLKTGDIFNYDKFFETVKLSPQALSLLEKNGFAVVNTPEAISQKPDEFAAFYGDLKYKDLPVFITSDSLLHYYHIFFDTTLMKLERDLFYDDIWQMSKEFLDDAVNQYNASSGDLKEAGKRNAAYLSVALELLTPKKNQVISDATLKEEYCQSYMSKSECQSMIEGVKNTYGEKASYKYFSASDAQKYAFEIPDFIKNDVEKELNLVEKHEGWEFSPIFVYKEDYSQYVPRGHYTKSERLKNYFKAMMWYGRMTALIKGSPEIPEGKSACTGLFSGIVSEYDAKIQTLQAGLIADKFAQSADIQQKWQRMYAITAFMVGFSDDLGPYEYAAALKNAVGEPVSAQKIEEKLSAFKDTLSDLAYNPKIYGGLGQCELFMPCPPLSESALQELKAQAKNLLEETKGFRLMGQRFTIDSYLFSEIVSPYSGQYTGINLPLPTDKKPFTFSWDDPYSQYRKNRPFTWVRTDVKGCPPPASREVRGFPTGLDVMALFGSKRAAEIIKNSGDAQYSDYESKFSQLEAEIDSFSTDDWFKNLYLNWLYVLKSLLPEFGDGYQTFMQTEAWQDKELNTALASWTELRHDTILYVKQSYTMAELGGGGPGKPVVGYVEPVPEFYARLLTLTKMTDKGLKSLVPEEELEKLRVGYALDQFSEILGKLLEISKKELENKELTEDEYWFIDGFGDVSKNLIESVSGGDVDPEIFKTVMAADVHTEGNTEKALEEGVGYIKTLVAAYKHPQGHILLGAGPVFSYYEFKQPMAKRLTDETWRKILDSADHPDQPEWTKNFSE